MKRTTVLVAFCLCLVSAQAQAKDLKGKFAFGGKATLGGVVGFDMIYWVSSSFGLELIFDFDLYKPDGSDTQLSFGGSLGGLYNIAKSQNANFGIGLRLNLGLNRVSANNSTDTKLQFTIEIPLRVEYFFSDYFAIHFEVGLTFEIYGADGSVITASGQYSAPPGGQAPNRGGKGFGFGTGTGLLANGGFLFYF